MNPPRIFFKEPPQGPRLTLWDKLKLWRITKDKHMIEKLKSRKLWVAVSLAAFSTLLSGLGIDNELIEKIITLGMTYIGAQGLVDTAAAYATKPQAANPKPKA